MLLLSGALKTRGTWEQLTSSASRTVINKTAAIEAVEAMHQMQAHVELEIVPGAAYLFEEPGTLEQVADRAASWFTRYLRAAGSKRA